MNKKFEYKTLEIRPTGTWKSKFDIVEIDKILNDFGQEGWELVSMEDKNFGYGTTECFYYTFKREI